MPTSMYVRRTRVKPMNVSRALFSWCSLLLRMVMMALWMKRPRARVPDRQKNLSATNSGVYEGDVASWMSTLMPHLLA